MTEPMTPPFQVTPLAASAAAHNELVTTYQAAGFSRQEAMQILMLMMWYGLLSNSEQ